MINITHFVEHLKASEPATRSTAPGNRPLDGGLYIYIYIYIYICVKDGIKVEAAQVEWGSDEEPTHLIDNNSNNNDKTSILLNYYNYNVTSIVVTINYY